MIQEKRHQESTLVEQEDLHEVVILGVAEEAIVIDIILEEETEEGTMTWAIGVIDMSLIEDIHERDLLTIDTPLTMREDRHIMKEGDQDHLIKINSVCLSFYHQCST